MVPVIGCSPARSFFDTFRAFPLPFFMFFRLGPERRRTVVGRPSLGADR
jgi:hypothetical protein